jgi:hypothetical protein
MEGFHFHFSKFSSRLNTNIGDIRGKLALLLDTLGKDRCDQLLSEALWPDRTQARLSLVWQGQSLARRNA